MKKSKIKISAVIITKNAARSLAKVLESIGNLSEEIIIVDSGSTDQTLDIAKKFGCKIIRQEWLGYGAQKNLGINAAKNNWVLSLDADEIVSRELAKSISNANYDNFDGFNISFRNYFGGKWVKHSGWYPDWHLRIFRRDKMQFETTDVHELVKPVGKIGYLEGDIIHHTYLSNRHYFQKIEGYTTLDAKYLYKKKRKWSIFYQLGKPIKEFFQIYFGRGGYLDGLLGLKIACFSAYYRFLTAKKLRVLYRNDKI